MRIYCGLFFDRFWPLRFFFKRIKSLMYWSYTHAQYKFYSSEAFHSSRRVCGKIKDPSPYGPLQALLSYSFSHQLHEVHTNYEIFFRLLSSDLKSLVTKRRNNWLQGRNICVNVICVWYCNRGLGGRERKKTAAAVP